MKYIEFCCGVGGMRSGLDAAGWKCVFAVDNDPDAVAVHQIAHGDAVQADVTELDTKCLPEADVWIAGFPCQPFSTSGNRLGFGHRSGNVFEHLARHMKTVLPPIVVLENVEGLLTNKSGHTFAMVLTQLVQLGYSIDWLTLNLRWFGPPQTRARVFLIASQNGVMESSLLPSRGDLLPGFECGHLSVFSRLLAKMDLACTWRSDGTLSEVEEELRPAIGKARFTGQRTFGATGMASQEKFISYDLIGKGPSRLSRTLSEIVAPNFTAGDSIRSGRYYARGGPTRFCLRDAPISHCVGTSLGGAPLYAVPLTTVRTRGQRAAFLQYANWHREQDGLLVMRLRPDRAVLLFGPHTSALQHAITTWEAGDTRKYKLVGNMVAPICATAVAELITTQLSQHHSNALVQS